MMSTVLSFCRPPAYLKGLSMQTSSIILFNLHYSNRKDYERDAACWVKTGIRNGSYRRQWLSLFLGQKNFHYSQALSAKSLYRIQTNN